MDGPGLGRTRSGSLLKSLIKVAAMKMGMFLRTDRGNNGKSRAVCGQYSSDSGV